MIQPARYIEGATRRTFDPGDRVQPRSISIDGHLVMAGHATGIAIVTLDGGERWQNGRLGILSYEFGDDRRPGGIGLIRPLSPDDADEFADRLRETATALRNEATAKAAAALHKARGR